MLQPHSHTGHTGHASHTRHVGLPGPDARLSRGRIDVPALKRRFPIEEVIQRYGVDLRGGGSALVGLCPFHDDHTPSLHVYPATASYFCFSCDFGGDVVDFVERREGLDFRAAVARLTDAPPILAHGAGRPHLRLVPGRRRGPDRDPDVTRDADALACIAVAVEIYHRRLFCDTRAARYLRERGVDTATARRCRLGYAAGGELAGALRARGIPPSEAERAGLLRGGRETFTGRLVVPEMRAGRPVWLVGRAIGPARRRYHSLAGQKPLLGWEAALAASRRGQPVVVVEGPFDWLALVRWGVAAVTPVGTHARPGVVCQLARLAERAPLHIAFDADEPGVIACFELQDQLEALGRRAEPVWLPRVGGRRVKDVGDLAQLPEGRDAFLAALERSARRAAA